MIERSNALYANETIPVFARWFGSWQITVRRQAFSALELTRIDDRAAPRWGRMLDRLWYPVAYQGLLRKALGEDALRLARARPRVLDCGVGTGALSIALARVLAAPFQLDAVDISPRMRPSIWFPRDPLGERLSEAFRFQELGFGTAVRGEEISLSQ